MLILCNAKIMNRRGEERVLLKNCTPSFYFVQRPLVSIYSLLKDIFISIQPFWWSLEWTRDISYWVAFLRLKSFFKKPFEMVLSHDTTHLKIMLDTKTTHNEVTRHWLIVAVVMNKGYLFLRGVYRNFFLNKGKSSSLCYSITGA